MKRTFSLVLALVMILGLVLTGCGGNNSATTTAAGTTAAVQKTTAAGTTAAAPADGFGGVTIDWYHNCSLDDGRTRAFETADALASETLGINLQTHWVEPAEYYAKLQNLVATGQAPDVFYGAANVLVPFARDGVLLALDDYLDSYMPVSKSNVPENLWPAYTFSGSIYAIPPRKDLAENNSILYYIDKLEEANIEMPEWQRFGPDIFETLYDLREWRDEAYPEEKDEIISGFFDNFYTANCLERYAGSCVVTQYDGLDYLGYEPGVEMFCAFDSPEYLNHMKTIKQMVDDRIFAYDRSNFDKELVKRKAGDYYVWTSQGYILAPTGSVEYECGLAKQKLSMMYTGYAQAAVNMVSADTESPEAAVSFIEFMSTNKEWGTIVRFGIEGKNYVIDENGFVDCAAEGMENIKYWYGIMFGDICNCVLPNDCAAGDFVAEIDILNNNNVASQNLGFSPDTTDVSAELAAVANVVSEYDVSTNMRSGMIDAATLESLYEEFVTKLHANGVDTLIEEFQAQRDAWAENH